MDGEERLGMRLSFLGSGATEEEEDNFKNQRYIAHYILCALS